MCGRANSALSLPFPLRPPPHAHSLTLFYPHSHTHTPLLTSPPCDLGLKTARTHTQNQFQEEMVFPRFLSLLALAAAASAGLTPLIDYVIPVWPSISCSNPGFDPPLCPTQDGSACQVKRREKKERAETRPPLRARAALSVRSPRVPRPLPHPPGPAALQAHAGLHRPGPGPGGGMPQLLLLHGAVS